MSRDAELAQGKLPASLLSQLLARAAVPGDEVLLGPRVGEDAAAIAVERGTLVVATDPITLTSSQVGAHAVVINANDVAVMGAQPRWFLACVLVPPDTQREALVELFEAMRGALDDVGAVLVGGHTEVSAAVNQPVVVGQMLGLRSDGRVIPTGGLKPRDVVVQVGRAPVEGALVLAEALPSAAGEVSPEVWAAARDAARVPGFSVVRAALRAADLGAVALHDPTEGGLSAGRHEMAEASGVAVRVDPEAVLWFEPGLELCRLVRADPWGTLASGALLAGFRSDTDAVAALSKEGFEVRVLARAVAGRGVTFLDASPLPRYERDEVSRVFE